MTSGMVLPEGRGLDMGLLPLGPSIMPGTEDALSKY